MSAMEVRDYPVRLAGGSPIALRGRGSFFGTEINGKGVQVDADPAMPLLWVLRDVLNMTGTKFGCGVAACGACTVRVDGQAVRSCVMPVSAVAGKKIRPSRRWARRQGRTACRRPGLPSRCPNAAIAKAAC
jgi:hypothetical protein